jgi:tRNA(fMet)-specific endonuclease VapC
MILLDTDHLSVLTDPRDRRHSSLSARLDGVTEPVLLPIVCVEESLRGWLAQISRKRTPREQLSPYQRLTAFIEFVRDWRIAEWNEDAVGNFESLRSSRIRVGTQDLKIASIALANNALLLSANLIDFERVPRLRVEDWST